MLSLFKQYRIYQAYLGLILSLSLIVSVQAATDCAVQTEIPQAECEDLITLYDSTNGDNWTDNTGWKVTNSLCSWKGITCSDGNVTKIVLSDNQLTGNIINLSALTHLEMLALSNNKLTGSIPDFVALINLRWLGLSNNQLTSNVPDFSTLTNLGGLFLYGNQLTGSIPDFSTLTSLTNLHLHSNQLTGSIPDLSVLSNLQFLNLNNNKLTGSIPDFSTLTSLTNLHLSNNELTGSIPNLSALNNLQEFSLFGNSLCKDTAINYSPWEEKVDIYPFCTPPTANFTLSPIGGQAPLNVTFDASGSYDSDGSIIKYEWFIDDEFFSFLNPISHTFPEGRYTIGLTVTDNEGLTQSTEQSIIVDAPALETTIPTEIRCSSCIPEQSCLCFDLQPNKDFFAVGEKLTLDLHIDAHQPNRFKQVDLYVIFELPPFYGKPSPFLYATGMAFFPFDTEPTAFMQGLEQYSSTFNTLDIEVRPCMGGQYKFYAGFVLEHDFPRVDNLVSNLAQGQVTLEDYCR